MNDEQIKFKVGLSGTYWDKKPQYRICVGGKECLTGEITAPSGQVEYVEFTAQLDEGDSALEIFLTNKELSDTVKDDPENPNFTIVKDLLLNIEHIEVDDIDLGHLRFSKSYFKPLKKQLYQGAIVDRIEKCVNLGFNGAYTLEFSSPFYIWLLENL